MKLEANMVNMLDSHLQRMQFDLQLLFAPSVPVEHILEEKKKHCLFKPLIPQAELDNIALISEFNALLSRACPFFFCCIVFKNWKEETQAAARTL